MRDTGVGAATGGLASVEVLRATKGAERAPLRHDGELFFFYVLGGGLELDGGPQGGLRLGAGDCFTLPAATGFTLAPLDAELELLEVRLPASG